MNLQELQEKRNRLFAETQTLLQEKELTPEVRTKSEQMLADLDVIEKDIESRTRLEAFEQRMSASTKPNRGTPGAGAEVADGKDEAVKRAYSNYLRFGDRELSTEDRAILRENRAITTSGTQGGYVIPQLFDQTIYQAQKFIGGTLNRVGRKITNNNGAPMKIALLNDTANVLTTITGGETTAVSETDPGFAGVMSNTDTIATQVNVSFQELEDASFDLDTFIKQAFATRFYRGIEQLIATGNGSNVASLVSGATLGATATGTYSAGNVLNLVSGQVGPQYDDFVAIYGSLDPAYINENTCWVMNSQSRAYLMGQKDNYGRPLFIPNPNTGALDSILGIPVVLNQALPYCVNTSTTLTAAGIVLGDLTQGYLLRQDGGLNIRRSDDVLLQQLTTVFVAWSRIGGVSVDAGTHPILKLVTPVA
jgi:HK97 family phage major capsid protein